MTSSSSRKDKKDEMVTQYFHIKNLWKILFLEMSDLVNFFRITVLLNLPKTLSILRVQSKSFSMKRAFLSSFRNIFITKIIWYILTLSYFHSRWHTPQKVRTAHFFFFIKHEWWFYYTYCTSTLFSNIFLFQKCYGRA